MSEEIRKCQYCGEPIEGGRSTKKYCSDTCKQAAFYNRSALQSMPLAADEPLNGNDGQTDRESITTD